MGKGKIAAQCSHATLGLYKKLYNRAPKALGRWEMCGQVKVVVKIESEDDMLVLQDPVRDVLDISEDLDMLLSTITILDFERLPTYREGYLVHSIDRVTTERFIKCFEDVGLMKYLAHDYKMVYLLNATELFANARLEKDEIHWRVNETDAVIVHGDIRALFDFPVCEGERLDCPGHAYNQEAL
nr:peptidyl-tRNA hydrolase 2, mitochondrial-like [Ipomoea batatas]